MHGNIKDLTGNKYGNLTVLEITNLHTEKKRSAVWKCVCDCGNICYKTSSDLKDPRRKTCSCGCMTKGNRKFPNKFVEKEPYINAKEKFVSQLLEYFKDAEFISELKTGIESINKKNKKIT